MCVTAAPVKPLAYETNSLFYLEKLKHKMSKNSYFRGDTERDGTELYGLTSCLLRKSYFGTKPIQDENGQINDS